MSKPRRRILLPLLLALCLGWPTAWLVGKILEPKPVFEVSIAPGYTAMIYQGSLHVSSIIDWSTYLYDLGTGNRLTLLDGKFNTVEDTEEPIITRPTQKITLTDVVPPYYFNFSHERDNKKRNRWIYYDPVTGLSYRFHGYMEDDKYDEVVGNANHRSKYCLLRRHLPFDVLLSGGPTPLDSPASLLLNQVIKLKPLACPSLHTIVTIPEKQIVCSFVLDGSWTSSIGITLSPTGRYVACNRINSEYMKHSYKGDQLHRFWDIQEERWLIPQTEADVLTYTGNGSFMSEELYVGDELLNAYTIHLLNIKTGQLLDRSEGISVNYFATKQVVKSHDGFLWYLRRHDNNNSGISYELRSIKNSSKVETFGKHSWDHVKIGITLTQGMQSIVSNDGQTSFLQIFKSRFGDSAFYKILEPWLIRPSTSIYDWNTGSTYAGWNGDHKWQMSNNGEYLLIVDRQTIDEKTTQELLARVYRFPLEFYSPWWHRGAGILIGILTFVIFWRWQTKRLLKPSP